jgi:uncharacterized membrane protein
MNRIVVIVFDKASQAAKGRDALKSLDKDESITLFGYAIVTKDADCTTTISEQHKHRHTHRTPSGTAIETVIAMLSGSAAVPAPTEDLPGVRPNPDDLQVNADFIRDVSREFVPGKTALLADIDEEWTPWINIRMEEIGGIVFRCPLADVKEAAWLDDLASMQAEVSRLRAEHARSGADLKARLYKKINALDGRIQQRLESANKRRTVAAAKAEERADALENAAHRTR